MFTVPAARVPVPGKWRASPVKERRYPQSISKGSFDPSHKRKWKWWEVYGKDSSQEINSDRSILEVPLHRPYVSTMIFFTKYTQSREVHSETDILLRWHHRCDLHRVSPCGCTCTRSTAKTEFRHPTPCIVCSGPVPEHPPGQLKQQLLIFSQFWRPEVQVQGVSGIGVSWGLSPWLVCRWPPSPWVLTWLPLALCALLLSGHQSY